jgi:hypothetical protein
MDRDFEIYLNDGDEIGTFFRDAAGIIERIGGVIQIGAIRAKLDDDQYETIGVRAHWESFMPAVAPPADEQPDEPAEPDED